MSVAKMSSRCVMLSTVILAGWFAHDKQCQADEPVSDSVRRRCENIVKSWLSKPLPAHEESRALRISSFGDYPVDWVEGTLVTALSDESSLVRLEAADVLSSNAGTKNRAAILKALDELEGKDEVDRCRTAIIRWRLGEARAVTEVRRWAALQVELVGAGEVWGCAMHPQFKTARKGTCPICSLDLVPFSPRPTFVQRKAQQVALAALADREDSVASPAARLVLSSDAAAFWRLGAACALARTSQEDALPHVRVFLDSPDQHVRYKALEFLAQYCPKQNGDTFRAVLRDHRTPSYERLLAIRGLLGAGQMDLLKELRRLLSEPGDDGLSRFEVFRLLADFGTNEDVKLLERFLDSKEQQSAAEAMLRIMTRPSEHHTQTKTE